MADKEETRTCVDCGAKAPATETAHTLIGAQHGWRLTARKTPTGSVPEWRCPNCWRALKAKSKEQAGKP